MAENPRPVRPSPEAERHMDGDSSGRGSGHFAAELTKPWPSPCVEATTHPDARAVPRSLSAASIEIQGTQHPLPSVALANELLAVGFSAANGRRERVSEWRMPRLSGCRGLVRWPLRKPHCRLEPDGREM
jgi:hypothetical protein